MTISELAKNYLLRIISLSDKVREISLIEKEINKLSYTENKQPLSVDDKMKIWEEIRFEIQRLIIASQPKAAVRRIRSLPKKMACSKRLIIEEATRNTKITGATSNTEIIKIVAETEKKLKGKEYEYKFSYRYCSRDSNNNFIICGFFCR